MNKNDANIQMTNYIHTEIGCARKRKNYHRKKPMQKRKRRGRNECALKRQKYNNYKKWGKKNKEQTQK